MINNYVRVIRAFLPFASCEIAATLCNGSLFMYCLFFVVADLGISLLRVCVCMSCVLYTYTSSCDYINTASPYSTLTIGNLLGRSKVCVYTIKKVHTCTRINLICA